MKFLAGLFFFATLHTVTASDLSSFGSLYDYSANFNKGTHEGSVGAAVFFSPFLATSGRPTENYAGPIAHFGWMLNSPDSNANWSGNFEFAGEVFGGGIFAGPGNYVANGTLWLRYNLLTPAKRIVPYLQLGAGVTFMDADQKSFGQVFNFNEGAGFGVRYFIQPNCSLNGEYRFHHISNASMSEHNLGINAQGAVFSVSWYF